MKGSPRNRVASAKESFKSASEAIGELRNGMSLFTITRGQFSMIDVILHLIDQCKEPAELSIWTWAIAEYEIQCFERLMMDSRISKALLMIDKMATKKNRDLLLKWQGIFGKDSIKVVCNHAKIATIKTDKYKILARGSMNLNFNPRFEQLDVTEGGMDYDLVKEIENGLPILSLNCSGAEVQKACKLNNAFNENQLDLFKGVKIWNK